MLEIILPCPNCQTSLLVDEQVAGSDVLCPGCDARLTLPRDLSGASLPVLKSPAQPGEPIGLPASRRNQPLHRTGQPAPLPEESAGAPSQEQRTQLPERRGLTPEEEMRRMAALTADPGKFDLHNVDTRGRSAFPCPACHRPVWISGSEWGREVVCSGCSQTIVAPDPSTGAPAKTVTPAGAEARPKTVLPARRQVENLGAGEQQAAGRPKRQGGQLPTAREAGPSPARQAPGPAREPIPARGDVELSAPVRKGPPARRAVTPAQEQNAVAAEFEATAPAADPAAPPAGKFVQRLGNERNPTFTPKHEADLSVETTGNWGGSTPQEQSVAFRRLLTFAIITLLVGGVVITAYLVSDNWREKPAQSTKPNEPESPVQNVDWAKSALRRFIDATTVEDMAKEVRHPEITLPRMKEWYARLGVPKIQMEFTDDWREKDAWQGSASNFLFTVVKLDGFTQTEIALETFTDGRTPKLDWESFVAWSERPWIDFLKETSEQPAEFRVSVTLVEYYNGYYSDRQRYLSFRVSDRNNEGSCWAYCDANSEAGKALKLAVRAGRQSGRTASETGEGIAQVILRLRYLPEGKQYNQAAIDKVLSTSWLQP